MKHLTRFTTTAAMLAGLGLSVPAYAAAPSDARQLVNDATQTVHQIERDSDFAHLLREAKGVFIMPNMVKGAFIIGGKGGEGVLLAHKNGTWSDPAFLSAASVSIGAQAGGKVGPVAMLLMTDKALNDFTQANNFSLNANAGLTVINYSKHGQAPVGKGDVIVWSKANGAYAGVNVNGTDITSNTQENWDFYGQKMTTPEIIHGDTHNQQAEALRNALPG